MNIKNTILSLLTIILCASPVSAALKPNDLAPAFSLPDAEGKEFQLSDFIGAGKKINGVMVNFFASWCVPCRAELPLISSMTDDLNRNGIKVILINVKERRETIRALLSELKVDKPLVLSDRDGNVVKQYGVLFLPTTFFIGADGRIKDVIFGEIQSADKLRASANKLLSDQHGLENGGDGGRQTVRIR